MSWADDLSAHLKDWGKAAFAYELETGFSRARIFDGKWAQMDFDVLTQFPTDDLKVLGNLLPVMDEDFRKSLADRESRLFEAFLEARKELVLSRREKFIAETMLSAAEPLRGELVKIKGMASGIFKGIAKGWECKMQKADSSVWMLSRRERWGEISMIFDLHEPMEFSYSISIEDNDYRRVLDKDGYLGRLGLCGKSACRLISAEMFAEKMEKVAEIIEWQLDEYTKIIEPLGWPRIASFS